MTGSRAATRQHPGTDEPISDEWLVLHCPPYSIKLDALRVLPGAGRLRPAEAR